MKKLYFLPCVVVAFLLQITWPYMQRFISGPSILSQWCVYLSSSLPHFLHHCCLCSRFLNYSYIFLKRKLWSFFRSTSYVDFISEKNKPTYRVSSTLSNSFSLLVLKILFGTGGMEISFPRHSWIFAFAMPSLIQSPGSRCQVDRLCNRGLLIRGRDSRATGWARKCTIQSYKQYVGYRTMLL